MRISVLYVYMVRVVLIMLMTQGDGQLSEVYDVLINRSMSNIIFMVIK